MRERLGGGDGVIVTLKLALWEGHGQVMSLL